MDINEHPIYKDIYDLCHEIEKLPASEQATKVVVMASALEKPATKLVKALQTIAQYDKESIWSDDRDDAADGMLSVAREALGIEP